MVRSMRPTPVALVIPLDEEFEQVTHEFVAVRSEPRNGEEYYILREPATTLEFPAMVLGDMGLEHAGFSPTDWARVPQLI